MNLQQTYREVYDCLSEPSEGMRAGMAASEHKQALLAIAHQLIVEAGRELAIRAHDQRGNEASL